MGHIAVVGSLHMDVIVNAPDRPRKGETLRGHGWALQAGGKGGNQAVQAAQQGAQVYMIGRTGDDDFGYKQRAALMNAGVNIDYLRLDLSAGSGMSVAIVDADGDYGAVIVSGVNMHIDHTDLEAAAEVIGGADYLLLQYEIPLPSVVAAAQFAQAHDTRVILNAAPAYPAPDGLLAAVDILVVNEVEAEMITGQPVDSVLAARRAAETLGADVPVVLVTLGDAGVVLAERDHPTRHFPAHRVELVDAHGAGDAFIGALAARLSAGDSLADAIHYANATAALMCQNAGPQAPDLTPERVRAFLSAGV